MEQIKFVNNKIYTGIVNHTRFTPFHHNFSYKVTYFWFCINTFKNYIFFKRNKISLFSFFDKDHCNVHKKDKLESFFYKKKLKNTIKPIFIKLMFCAYHEFLVTTLIQFQSLLYTISKNNHMGSC